MKSIFKDELNKYVTVLHQDILDLEKNYIDCKENLDAERLRYEELMANKTIGYICLRSTWGSKPYTEIDLNLENEDVLHLFQEYQKQIEMEKLQESKKDKNPWYKFW